MGREYNNCIDITIEGYNNFTEVTQWWVNQWWVTWIERTISPKDSHLESLLLCLFECIFGDPFSIRESNLFYTTRDQVRSLY